MMTASTMIRQLTLKKVLNFAGLGPQCHALSRG